MGVPDFYNDCVPCISEVYLVFLRKVHLEYTGIKYIFDLLHSNYGHNQKYMCKVSDL